MSLCSWTQKEERQKGRARCYWSNSKTSQNVTMWEGQDVRRGRKAKRYRIVSLRGREEMERHTLVHQSAAIECICDGHPDCTSPNAQKLNQNITGAAIICWGSDLEPESVQ